MSERGHGYPDGFRLSLILEFERFGIAIRLLFAYPFGHPESEQNSSLNCCAPVDVLRSRVIARISTATTMNGGRNRGNDRCSRPKRPEVWCDLGRWFGNPASRNEYFGVISLSSRQTRPAFSNRQSPVSKRTSLARPGPKYASHLGSGVSSTCRKATWLSPLRSPDQTRCA